MIGWMDGLSASLRSPKTYDENFAIRLIYRELIWSRYYKKYFTNSCLIWTFPSHIFIIFVFSTYFNEQLKDKIFVDVGIQTADLWCRYQPLYQLSHNHFPEHYKFFAATLIFYVKNLIGNGIASEVTFSFLTQQPRV